MTKLGMGMAVTLTSQQPKYRTLSSAFVTTTTTTTTTTTLVLQKSTSRVTTTTIRPYPTTAGTLVPSFFCCYFHHLLSHFPTTTFRRPSILFTTRNMSCNNNNNNNNDNKDLLHQERIDLLHPQLTSIGIPAQELHDAAMQSILQPTKGYHSTFGKSAIRAYRSFVFPKQPKYNNNNQNNNNNSNNAPTNADTTSTTTTTLSTSSMSWIMATASAQRTARQIEFLIKRHKSHQIDWIRHHDPTTMLHTQPQQSPQPQQIENGTFHGNNNNNNNNNNNIYNNHKQQYPNFPKIILLLDNIRSAMNVGSLFRTADATNCDAIYTCGVTPHPNGNGNDKLSKSALGAQHYVYSRHFDTTQQAIQYLQQLPTTTTTISSPVIIIGLETTQKSICYTSLDYMSLTGMAGKTQSNSINNDSTETSSTTTPNAAATTTTTTTSPTIVLVLGNEVTGVDTDILSQLNYIVEIPTFGMKNSLNVAACAPIVLYEIIRQWQMNEIHGSMKETTCTTTTTSTNTTTSS